MLIEDIDNFGELVQSQNQNFLCHFENADCTLVGLKPYEADWEVGKKLCLIDTVACLQPNQSLIHWLCSLKVGPFFTSPRFFLHSFDLEHMLTLLLLSQDRDFTVPSSSLSRQKGCPEMDKKQFFTCFLPHFQVKIN